MSTTTVSRTSNTTTLRIGPVKTPIALYKITSESAAKARKWDLADGDGEPWSPPAAAATPPEPQGEPLGAPAAPVGGAVAGGPPPAAGEGEEPPQGEPQGGGAPIGGAVPPAGQAEEPPVGEEEAEEEAQPRKGIRKADGAFVDLTDQIGEIAERATLEEMRVVSFIDVRHVPRERVIAAYYLAGDSMNEAASADSDTWPPGRLLRVISTAMRSTQKVAVVRFTKRKGQALGVLTWRRDGALVLLELAFAAQVRRPNGKCLAHTKAEVVSPGAVKGAIELIEAMAAKRDSLDGIRDARVVMEDELIARAEAGELDDYELVADLDVAEETEQLGALLAEAAKVTA
jgi:hypothetical protein